MSLKSFLGLVILLGLTVPAVAAPDCPLEKAYYAVRDEQGVTAGFQLRAEGLFFFVHAAAKDSTQWFLPVMPGKLVLTADGIAAVPADNGALDYSATDGADHALPGFVFQPGVKAPAHIVIPRLQEILQYGFVPDSRESQSLAFLDLAGCDNQ